MVDFLVEEKSNTSSSVKSLAENHSCTNQNGIHDEGLSGVNERERDQPSHTEEELQNSGSLSTLPNQLVSTGKNTFLYKYHITVHQHSHTGERPHSCDKSRKSYNFPASLRCHKCSYQ
ncbi:hypothetical protein XENOCAPTIV_003002 [Xenoophorus captivus]|uniref:Uncharacterized protein n=1 Tax=Xenoophorus captivus TaxID=1517983 RepID=A0ABV0RF70_9TELE